jgi:hypothetical protein
MMVRAPMFSIAKVNVALAIAYLVFNVTLFYLLDSNMINSDISLGVFLLGFGIMVILVIKLQQKRRRQNLTQKFFP